MYMYVHMYAYAYVYVCINRFYLDDEFKNVRERSLSWVLEDTRLYRN